MKKIRGTVNFNHAREFLFSTVRRRCIAWIGR